MKISILMFWLLLASGVHGQEPASPEIYDILLKNGRVLDPTGKHNGRFDIAIVRNKIVRIAPDLRSPSARNTIDLSGCFVTAGFIDINAHVDARGAWRSVNPDHHSLRSGVTTVVDSGSTGWKTFESFKRTVIDRSRTRVLAFLNIAAGRYFERRPRDPSRRSRRGAGRRHDAKIPGFDRRHPNPVRGRHGLEAA